MLDGLWPYLHSQLIHKGVSNKLKWSCLMLQIAILSQWNFFHSTFLFLLQSTPTSTQLTSYYYFSCLKYIFSSFLAYHLFYQSFNSVKKSVLILSSCHTPSEEISTFLPYWLCTPLFHFNAISKRIKLQKWDCTHLVDFSI